MRRRLALTSEILLGPGRRSRGPVTQQWRAGVQRLGFAAGARDDSHKCRARAYFAQGVADDRLRRGRRGTFRPRGAAYSNPECAL